MKKVNFRGLKKHPILGKVGGVGEASEFFLHSLGEHWIENERLVKSRMNLGSRIFLPDWTGVRTGVTLVNSWSKLLVSVGLLMVGMNGGGTRLW